MKDGRKIEKAWREGRREEWREIVDEREGERVQTIKVDMDGWS